MRKVISFITALIMRSTSGYMFTDTGSGILSVAFPFPEPDVSVYEHEDDRKDWSIPTRKAASCLSGQVRDTEAVWWVIIRLP